MSVFFEDLASNDKVCINCLVHGEMVVVQIVDTFPCNEIPVCSDCGQNIALEQERSHDFERVQVTRSCFGTKCMRCDWRDHD